MTVLRILNLVLLVAFPVSWLLPLTKTGFLPFLRLNEVSIITGVQALWQSDRMLALIVAFFAMVAPVLKTAALSAWQFHLLTPRALPVIEVLGKLAMADVFLVALYIVIVKGVGVGRIETAYGLYVFTACVIASLVLTQLSKSVLQGSVPRGGG